MDYEGNVLAEPQFDYIDGYDPEHHLITVGEDDATLGVYSLEQERMIIPAEYDYIDYSESFIDCETKYKSKSRLFDYLGNEIFFQDYDSVFELKDYLNVWKDGKAGIIDKKGQVIIPPVLRSGLSIDVEYYMKGYLITGTQRTYGLSSTDGRTIIPHIYSDIYFKENFIIASEQNDRNWHLRDSLYTIDGKLLLSGVQRNIAFNEKDHTLTMETPLGILYCRIYTGHDII